MWYLVLYLMFAIWVFFDARKRMNHTIGWPAATLVLGPVMLPVYFAKRHLKAGETREGGTAWNVIKNFALFWTLTMGAAIIAGMVGVGQIADRAATDAERAGTALGATLGLGVMLLIWFLVLVAALVIGLFLKKSSMGQLGRWGRLG